METVTEAGAAMAAVALASKAAAENSARRMRWLPGCIQ